MLNRALREALSTTLRVSEAPPPATAQKAPKPEKQEDRQFPAVYKSLPETLSEERSKTLAKELCAL
jgi:hypothetical protein